ncbi:MAG TPA: hypothetical protein PLV45_06650 [bacterium]|nr:hypothetical protein [bacterium]
MANLMERPCEPDPLEKLQMKEELERLFSENDFSDILCDGRCATCLQREWCLLTPASRYVK